VRPGLAELGFSGDPPSAALRLSGRVDVSAHDEITDLFRFAAVCGCHDLQLDLSGVAFIDVETLFLLDAQRRAVTAAGGSFVVVAESSCYRGARQRAAYIVVAVGDLAIAGRRREAPDRRRARRRPVRGPRPVRRASRRP
jgi:hypothetical protein